jgi:uncharacterized protein YcgI (DUF1989 family)
MDTVIGPAQGKAFKLAKGDAFRITDIEGQQVSDLVVFLAADLHESFSPGNTRKLNNSLLLSEGAVLYSRKCTPLLRIRTDQVKRHDITASWCNQYDYPIRFGLHDHPSCLSILCDVLRPFEIVEYMIPEPFNVFMNVSIDENSGDLVVMAPTSKPGDYIEFEALSDCVVAMTACPQDQNACNGGRITPLRVETIEHRAH